MDVTADVPEFGTWALLIALGLAIGGFIVFRRKR
ncbi:PEP-CTERM sorting domain-containing protein [Nanoarchaeota archaeon]